jgi:DNA-binding NtrC family response regulator
MHVLAIDDDVAYRMACAAVLAEDGHDVNACDSVDEGSEWLQRDRVRRADLLTHARRARRRPSHQTRAHDRN